MIFGNTLKKSVASVSCAAGLLLGLGSASSAMENYTNNSLGDGRVPAHTFFSKLANEQLDAGIDRYRDCDVTVELGPRGPYSCDTWTTVEYDGNSPLEWIAAHAPRGSDSGVGLSLLVAGVLLFPGRKEDEDNQPKPRSIYEVGF